MSDFFDQPNTENQEVETSVDSSFGDEFQGAPIADSNSFLEENPNTPDIEVESTGDSLGDHPFSTTSSNSSFTPVKSSSNYSFHSSDLDEDLPPYLEWKSKHQKDLEARRDKEREEEEELRKKASKELEVYKKERTEKIETLRSEHRKAQGGESQGSSGSNDWDTVAKLITVKDKLKEPSRKDTSRMKEVILSLKTEVAV